MSPFRFLQVNLSSLFLLPTRFGPGLALPLAWEMLLGPWVSGVWWGDGSVPLGPLNGRDIRTSKVTSDAFIARKISTTSTATRAMTKNTTYTLKNQKQEHWQEKIRERRAFWWLPSTRRSLGADPSFRGTRGGLCFSSPHSPRGAESRRCHYWCPVVCGRLWDLGKRLRKRRAMRGFSAGTWIFWHFYKFFLFLFFFCFFLFYFLSGCLSWVQLVDFRG